MSVVHATPGLLDIRAITTFGLHAKPGTDVPIGKFGTGLKYAIATLLREGCTIRLFIGEVEYEFFTMQGFFRELPFHQVYMKKRKGVLARWQKVELPFTTEHGKFWKPWQAFRELHSNTIDEGGKTDIYDNYPPSADETVFLIDGDEYVKAYYERDKTFLPGALTKRADDTRIQVFSEPSDHLYWRGIRVFDLEKPSVYTYNILDNMDLTEDRTLKYVWEAQSKIAGFVARSKDRKLINAIVSADAQKFFEGRIDFDYAYESPSQEFREVVGKKRSRGAYISPRALTYYEKYTPPPPPSEVTVRSRIEQWAYEDGLPEELKELLQYLLRCGLEDLKLPQPVDPNDDGIPF